jgi:hypothetical protein
MDTNTNDNTMKLNLYIDSMKNTNVVAVAVAAAAAVVVVVDDDDTTAVVDV